MTSQNIPVIVWLISKTNISDVALTKKETELNMFWKDFCIIGKIIFKYLF